MEEIQRLRMAIKTAANRKNLETNKEIADYLGYTDTYLSSMLNGNEKLSRKFLSHVCEKLDINRDYIKNGNCDGIPESINQTNNISGNNNSASNSISVSPSILFELLNKKIDEVQIQNQQIINLLNKLIENESK